MRAVDRARHRAPGSSDSSSATGQDHERTGAERGAGLRSSSRWCARTSSASPRDTDERLAYGRVDRIGGEALLTFCTADGDCRRTAKPIRDHTAAIATVLQWLGSDEAGTGIAGYRDIDAVGHRVAHGGERFHSLHAHR